MDKQKALISRRDMARLLGAGAGSLAALKFGGSSVLAGGAPGQFASLSYAQGADRPELTVGVQDNPDNLDPGLEGPTVVGARVLYSIYDPLIDIDYLNGDPIGMGTTLIGGLAETWSRIDDRTVELKLRAGLKFHDGSPVTSEDVKFTFDRIIGPDAEPTAYVLGQFSSYESVEIVDDLTFRLITKKPDPSVEVALTYGVIYVLPKAYVESVGVEEFNRIPVGTGPYKVVEHVVNDYIVLEAFDDYWAGPPPFSKVTFRVIPEVATRLVAVESNEIQIATNIPPDQANAIGSDSSVTGKSIVQANFHIYHFNCQHPNVSNKYVRQALNIGFDRQLLVDTLWQGNARVLNGLQAPEWGELYNPDRPGWVYDPERAKSLLEQGEYAGQEIVFRQLANYYMLGADAAQAIVGMWQEIGVNAKVEFVDNFTDDRENLMIRGWSTNIAPFDPVIPVWRASWGPVGICRTDGYWEPENPAFDEAGLILDGSMDPEERYTAFQTILDIFEDEAPATVIYNQTESYIVSKDVNWHPYTVYLMDLRERNLSFGL